VGSPDAALRDPSSSGRSAHYRRRGREALRAIGMERADRVDLLRDRLGDASAATAHPNGASRSWGGTHPAPRCGSTIAGGPVNAPGELITRARKSL